MGCGQDPSGVLPVLIFAAVFLTLAAPRRWFRHGGREEDEDPSEEESP